MQELEYQNRLSPLTCRLPSQPYVSLDNALPIAEGSKRAVFQLTSDRRVVFKVHRQKSLRKRFIRFFRRSAHSAEIYWCQRLHAHHPDCKHVPKVFGLICTDRGPALIEERISNVDGSPALRPLHYLQRHGRVEEVVEAIDILFHFLMDHHVVCNDISEQNLLIRQGRHQLHAVLIDGYGENHLIPYPTLSKRLNRRKLMRKKARILHRLMTAAARPFEVETGSDRLSNRVQTERHRQDQT